MNRKSPKGRAARRAAAPIRGLRGKIRTRFEESASIQRAFARAAAGRIEEVARLMAAAIHRGRKILLFGNGGSAADAQHVAAEFVNRFMIERRPLPALALTTDTSVLTSIGNDYSFEEVFSKQIRALGTRGDVAVGITTSGNSPNVLEGLRAARAGGLATVGFLGGEGGKALALVDHPLVVPSRTVSRIQESHITLAHVLCELIDEILFSPKTA